VHSLIKLILLFGATAALSLQHLVDELVSEAMDRVFERVLSSLAIVILHCTCWSPRLGGQPAEPIAYQRRNRREFSEEATSLSMGIQFIEALNSRKAATPHQNQ
jgi:hypothetical protein